VCESGSRGPVGHHAGTAARTVGSGPVNVLGVLPIPLITSPPVVWPAQKCNVCVDKSVRSRSSRLWCCSRRRARRPGISWEVCIADDAGLDITLADRPGTLAKATEAIAKAGINLE